MLASEPEAEISDGWTYLDAEHSPYDEEYASIDISGTATGEYTYYLDYFFIYCLDDENCYDAASGSISLDKIGEVGETIEGTFSFTTHPDLATETVHEVTDGRFILPRVSYE